MNISGQPEFVDSLDDLVDVGDLHARLDGWLRLIKNLSGGSVLAVTGVWGVGKTTALRMLESKLLDTTSEFEGEIQQQFSVCKIDAWANDDLEEPLLALLAALKDARPEPAAMQKLTESAISYIKPLTLAGVKVASNSLGVGSIVDAIESATNHKSELSLLLENLKSRNEVRQKFRTELSALAEDKKLILFVDELDRCRPDFALRLLERLKHFFEVPNVIVVLGVDLDSLSDVVQGSYGANFDGRRYLERFVHLELELKPSVNAALLRTLVFKFGLDPFFAGNQRWNNSKEAFVSTLLELARSSSWSIRRLERAIARLSLALHKLSQKQVFQGPLLALAIWFCLDRPKQMDKFVDGTVDLVDIVESLATELSDDSRYSVASVLGDYVSWLRLDEARKAQKSSLKIHSESGAASEAGAQMCQRALQVAQNPSTGTLADIGWISDLVQA